MYNWIISLYTRNQPNTANQLYLKKKPLCWLTKSPLILSTPFKVRLPKSLQTGQDWDSTEVTPPEPGEGSVGRWEETKEMGGCCWTFPRGWEEGGVPRTEFHGSFPHIPAVWLAQSVNLKPPGGEPGSSWRLLKSPFPSHLHSPQWRFLLHLLPTGRF